ncbi:16S rRNA (guanine(527)-N(7))-methyltransferase RsmG [Actinospongicola halichondriae]|uniref:16S rRNA (guanine(527)-N(7))-methyltransferase RsmG n=1 Tax=Actinospongicola halichondriae TaxID=3236844 RepID=UPI003D53EC80
MEPWETTVLACWARGQDRSAVGPGPLEEHLAHAKALAAHFRPDEASGLDVGTGAGVPGLALAGYLPEMRWVLLDAARRRIVVVQEAIDALGWNDRVTAVHGRAEDRRLLPPRSFDVVVARLFGPPAVTAECAAPLVRHGGRVLVTEPPDAEARWSTDGLAPLGLSLGERSASPSMQELRATGDPETRFPRKAGVARKRPLW